jgi:predicted ArsR family transcriptional regulator
MPAYRTGKESMDGTRDRLLRLLADEPRAVSELSGAIGVTLNAVRSQLAVLERDGLIQRTGERRGARRPSNLYGLTPEGERYLSRAYVPALKAILEAMSSRSTEEEVGSILREAGRRLATNLRQPSGGFNARLEKALDLLEDLGARLEVGKAEGKLILRGHGCPLSQAVMVEPQTCKCMETLLAELLGARVEERCERTGKPRCAFVIFLDEEAGN